ncbi:ATM interactor isoform X2 [Dendrobates tinctorius]|uniref:ATM interactor isoform X2 n=1 Tax=Dendrobates tinctorius TaxID=92724 RepID=UPI003CCA4E7D
MAARGVPRVRALYSCEHWEIVKPSDGITNPTLRKDLKASQKLYCCPIEGCPRGTNRPFSQFSRVKQHFMKMHAEKKHKCDKCGNSYGTEWDLKRHIGYCGKTFSCTCGCPYASRTALLSHTHRMGHEIPVEHRDPPVKKRKLEASKQNQKTVLEEQPTVSTANTHVNQQVADIKALATNETYESSPVTDIPCIQSNQAQKLLLPKPKLTLIKLPVVQLAHLPVLVSSAECSMKPMMVAVNNRGSVMSTLQILPPYNGTVLSGIDTDTSLSSSSVNTYVQVNIEASQPPISNTVITKTRTTSDVQTDLSFFSPNSWTSPESCVSSFSQTDLSISAQMSLPISVETQTLHESAAFPTKSLSEASINPGGTYGISRETQTNSMMRDNPLLVDQSVMCDSNFTSTSSLYTVSTQTNQAGQAYISGSLGQNLLETSNLKDLRVEEIKPTSFMNFNTQNGTFPPQNMIDNQTQTMELLSDLEKILSDNISGQSMSGGDHNLSSNCNQNPSLDFDIDEFFSASNIQTQTDESVLGNLNSEYLDIETQTDFLFSNDSVQPFTNKGNSNLLGMEMFDTQTQTDLNYFLDNSSHLRLGNILKQSSFSMSTDSSDAESHTDGASTSKSLPCPSPESNVQLNCAETQTTDSSFDTLGSLFLTSNETQTAMDDFLLADLAWNTMESQFSSVETQTCEERVSLFSEKSDN